jgi:hypothetical protein
MSTTAARLGIPSVIVGRSSRRPVPLAHGLKIARGKRVPRSRTGRSRMAVTIRRSRVDRSLTVLKGKGSRTEGKGSRVGRSRLADHKLSALLLSPSGLTRDVSLNARTTGTMAPAGRKSTRCKMLAGLLLSLQSQTGERCDDAARET